MLNLKKYLLIICLVLVGYVVVCGNVFAEDTYFFNAIEYNETIYQVSNYGMSVMENEMEVGDTTNQFGIYYPYRTENKFVLDNNESAFRSWEVATTNIFEVLLKTDTEYLELLRKVNPNKNLELQYITYMKKINNKFEIISVKSQAAKR